MPLFEATITVTKTVTTSYVRSFTKELKARDWDAASDKFDKYVDERQEAYSDNEFSLDGVVPDGEWSIEDTDEDVEISVESIDEVEA